VRLLSQLGIIIQFVIFIDRIKYYLSEAGIIVFADDTLLLVDAPSVNLLFDKMRKALVEFIEWADFNLLALNYTKTNYIYFLGHLVLKLIQN
jgi:hypothetical protein